MTEEEQKAFDALQAELKALRDKQAASDPQNLELRIKKALEERDALQKAADERAAAEAAAEKKRLEEAGEHKKLAEQAEAARVAAEAARKKAEDDLIAAKARVEAFEKQAAADREKRVKALREQVKALPEDVRKLVLKDDVKDEEVDPDGVERSLELLRAAGTIKQRPGGNGAPPPSGPDKEALTKAQQESRAAMSRNYSRL